MSVSCECCVLSGRGLCNGLIVCLDMFFSHFYVVLNSVFS